MLKMKVCPLFFQESSESESDQFHDGLESEDCCEEVVQRLEHVFQHNWHHVKLHCHWDHIDAWNLSCCYQANFPNYGKHGNLSVDCVNFEASTLCRNFKCQKNTLTNDSSNGEIEVFGSYNPMQKEPGSSVASIIGTLPSSQFLC